MGETNNWKKTQSIKVTCPSGTVVSLKRMGPELVLRSGKIQRLMSKVETVGGVTQEEKGLAFLEALTDDEVTKLSLFALEVVLNTVVAPRIVRNPGPDEIGPEDIPLSDFWFIYHYAMGLSRDLPVKTQEGETTVEAVETFPDGQAGSPGTGIDGEELQGAPC